MNMTLVYSDDLTATFTCTAFGGDGAMLVFSVAGFPFLLQPPVIEGLEHCDPSYSYHGCTQ